MSRFLSFGNEATAAPSPSPLPTEAPAQSSSAAWVLTPSGGLNLRETASANAAVLRVIPRLSRWSQYIPKATAGRSSAIKEPKAMYRAAS